LSKKFEGTSIPGGFLLKPLDCPASEEQAMKILDAIQEYHTDPSSMTAGLTTLRMYGQSLAESGWKHVLRTLDLISPVHR
jgi:hypothetical protein